MRGASTRAVLLLLLANTRATWALHSHADQTEQAAHTDQKEQATHTLHSHVDQKGQAAHTDHADQKGQAAHTDQKEQATHNATSGWDDPLANMKPLREWVMVEGYDDPQLKVAERMDVVRRAKYEVLGSKIRCPPIAILFKKGAIERNVTTSELYEAFVKDLKMERTFATKIGFDAIWTIASLPYKLDIYDLPAVHEVTSRLRSPGLNPQRFFEIKKAFGHFPKVCTPEARKITEFFYLDRPNIALARTLDLIRLPFSLLWNFVFDVPLWPLNTLKRQVHLDGLWFLLPLIVEAWGKDEPYYVHQEMALADGHKLMEEKFHRCMEWDVLQSFLLDSEMPPYETKQWGKVAFTNAAMGHFLGTD